MAASQLTEAKAPDFIHVNLLPIEYRVVRKDYSYLIDMRILVSTVALIAVGAAYLIGKSFFAANLESKRTELAQVQREIGANAYVGEKIKELEKLRDEKTAKNNSLKSISVSKKKWVRILEGINKSMPLNMWIETMKQSDANDNELEVKGRTYIFPEIAEYMLELEKNEYFSKVFLNSIELLKDQKSSSFMFTIRINMNPNVGLDRMIGVPAAAPGSVPDAVPAPQAGADPKEGA
ncbi:MAG: PilN domain-containing protein [Fibrobacteria bacterium]